MASECDSVGTVTVAGPVTDDTLQTFANGRVAQHPVDPLGIGVGVPRLLVDRATGTQEAARASGVPRLTAQRGWSMTCLTGRFHSQITSRFVARAWPAKARPIAKAEPVAQSTRHRFCLTHIRQTKSQIIYCCLTHIRQTKSHIIYCSQIL